MRSLDHCQTHSNRFELFPINYMKLDAATTYASVFLKSRLENTGSEVDTFQCQAVQSICVLFSVNVRRADQLEWPGCAPSFRHLRSFEMHGSRKHCCRINRRHVW